MIVIVLIMAGWMLSPIDIIPDTVPIVGALDDIAVVLISSVVLKKTQSEIAKG